MKPSSEELMEYAWLELGEAEGIDLSKHPFRSVKKIDIENPHEHILRLMMRPEHFPFTCKHIFNTEIIPIQHVVLMELWTKAFPMLIGNRGFGKSFLEGLYCILRALFSQGSKVVVVGAAFRQSKVVFEYCENLWANAPILRDIVGSDKGRGGRNNGPRRDIDRCDFILGDSVITFLPLGDGKKIRGQRACVDPWTIIETNKGLIRIKDYAKYIDDEDIEVFTGEGCNTEQPSHFLQTSPIDSYEVTTTGNYKFVCSEIHKVYSEEGWKFAKDLSPGDKLQFDNNYVFPEELISFDGFMLDDKLAFLLGMLVSEGCVTSKCQFSVKMADKSCVDLLAQTIAEINPSLNVCRYERAARPDSRFHKTKPTYEAQVCNLKFRETLLKFGLTRCKARQKFVPWSILRSPKYVVLGFLRGLFWGDGSAFLYKDRSRSNNLGVAYYSGSKQLIQDVQILLAKLNIFSCVQERKCRLSEHMQYQMRIYGRGAVDAVKLFDVPKWRKIVEEAFLNGKFISSRKTILVKHVRKLDNKRVLYDFTMPSSHSFMGNCFRQHNTHIIGEEFASIPIPIFENVVAGFGAVSANPIENVKEAARVRLLKKKNMWSEADEIVRQQNLRSNQLIISGTAYYEFNHFATYWKQYKNIIETRGDKKKLSALLNDQDPEGINHRDFSVIRIPMEILPERYMDEKSVARTKATISRNIYMMEYGAVFCNDSDGFFRATLINSCVVGKPDVPLSLPESGEVNFSAQLKGQKGVKHFFGVDPASESDNFAVVIVAVHSDHRKVVYSWTTTRSAYKRRLKAKLTDEHDFYGYAAKKIRELMKVFPCERILMDSQGGGVSVLEALQDPDKIPQGESPIWEIIDPDSKKRKDTDGNPGLHILELVQFARSDWVSEANHGLKKDMEDKVLLFPAVDPIAIGEALEQDKQEGRIIIQNGQEIALYDTLEDVVMEIEELKEELSTIVHTQTGATGRDHWDTPSTKSSTGKAGRLRKDRYSALLMSNMGARQACRFVPPPTYEPQGGWATQRANQKNPGAMYVGPEWFTQGYHGAATGKGGAVVRREI